MNIGFGKGRIESLTDGIFAFGMMLLVLGAGSPFTVATLAKTPANEILVNSMPDVILYVISFLLLAAFWVAHHSQFHHIRYIDRTLLWLNIIILMLIAFIPFTSTIAGIFPSDPIASAVFETHLLLTGLLFHLQWRYATKDHRLVDKDLPENTIRRGKEITLIIPVLSCVGIIQAALKYFLWSGCIHLCPLPPLVPAHKNPVVRRIFRYERKHFYGMQDEILLQVLPASFLPYTQVAQNRFQKYMIPGR